LRELLGQVPAPAVEATERADEAPVLPPCPCCGGRMIVIEVIERKTRSRHQPDSDFWVLHIDIRSTLDS
jgi:hypothetical protein